MTDVDARLFVFDNSYARLPERFFARQPATPVKAPSLLRLNAGLARVLGIDPARLAAPDGIAALAGNRVPDGAEPLAMAYAGHQFGHFVPQLGDGRAILLGEVVGTDGVRRDIHLKGAGRTPFSRGGDGRAALGPVLREFLVSEAMAALGVPTTRTLAATATGEFVLREEGPLPGAVLARVALSHVRVGTFEYFACREDTEALRVLAADTLARLYPESDPADPALVLLDGVVARTAKLVARWMALGFIHGVMNTDNVSLAGETIDYGPCAFMDAYDPAKVFSSIDAGGRYAYANQPRIAHWNLGRLARCLLPLLGDDENAALDRAQRAIDAFPGLFQRAYEGEMRAKLGLAREEAGDAALVDGLLERMAEGGADFTLAFRGLADAASGGGRARLLFADPAAFDTWTAAWRARLVREDAAADTIADRLRAANPAVIPRNHRVEAAIAAAYEGDLGPFDTLMGVLSRPFDPLPEHAAFTAPPEPHEEVRATFCGT
jgi:uncharacterized protein YdiU (UPF0061 family)